MTVDFKQLASSLVDDKLQTNQEIEQLMDDEQARSAVGRYQLIGQLMREETLYADLDISAQVSEAVAKEDSYARSNQNNSPASNVIAFPKRIWKQAGGLAIAASVAFVALVSLNNNGVSNSSQLTAAQFVSSDITNSGLQAPTLTVGDEQRGELQQMHQMFVEQQKLSSILGSGLPTVRVVSNQKVVPVKVPLRQDEQKDIQVKTTPEQTSPQVVPLPKQ